MDTEITIDQLLAADEVSIAQLLAVGEGEGEGEVSIAQVLESAYDPSRQQEFVEQVTGTIGSCLIWPVYYEAANAVWWAVQLTDAKLPEDDAKLYAYTMGHFVPTRQLARQFAKLLSDGQNALYSETRQAAYKQCECCRAYKPL